MYCDRSVPRVFCNFLNSNAIAFDNSELEMRLVGSFFCHSYRPLLPSCYVNVSDKLISFPRSFCHSHQLYGWWTSVCVHKTISTFLCATETQNLYYFIGFACVCAVILVLFLLFFCAFHINSFPQILQPRDNTEQIYCWKTKKPYTIVPHNFCWTKQALWLNDECVRCVRLVLFFLALLDAAFTLICHSSLIV